MDWRATAIAAVISFISGSIPFSLILVKAFAKEDISTFGEGNPGPANAFKAAGPLVGTAALLLDGFKAAIPVYLFAYSQSGWHQPIIAIAPILGHAFSPFLKFKGGKAITSSFGSWMGLTLWEGPVALGAGAVFAATVLKGKGEGAKLIPIIAALGIYLLLSGDSAPLWALFVANTAVLIIKQKQYASKGARV